MTYRSGKVALGNVESLKEFDRAKQNLVVKNADKIVLTDSDDTVISANFGNVIVTGDGADTIWLGSNGVAIKDLSEFDRLTIAGELELFGGIRNGNKNTPYAWSTALCAGPKTSPARCSHRSRRPRRVELFRTFP